MATYTLITGASSGMGALCAKRLSHERNLILASENLEMLQVTKGQCANPEKHLLWHCNFLTARDKIFESLSALLKENDAFVEDYIHFAGLTQILPVKNFTIPFVDKIFNVNFFSIIEILRVLLKKANARQMKSILLTSALFSKRGDIGNSIYAASKGAINSLAISLARELAPIRVNAILPGAIMTPMADKADPDHLARLEEETPLGLGKPENVIDYVEFLISDKASWITGQNIFIDGGRSTK